MRSLIFVLILLLFGCSDTPPPGVPDTGSPPVKAHNPPVIKQVTPVVTKPVEKPKPAVKAKPTNLNSGFSADFNWKKTGYNEYEEVDLQVTVNFKNSTINLYTDIDDISNSSNTLEIQDVHSNYVEMSGDNFYSSFSTVLNPDTWEERGAKQYDFNMEVINGSLNYISITSGGVKKEYYIQIPKESTAAPARQAVAKHIVKSGETLLHIAGKYGVTVSKIRSQNQLRGNTIYPGQVLDVSK
jgi:hypothetical protein